MLDEEKKPSIEVAKDEPEDQDQPSDVVVDLEKKEGKPEPVQAKPSADITKLHNTIAYQNRKLDQAMRELADVRRELQSRSVQTVQSVPQNQPQNQDDIDELAQRDWKLGVKKVVEKDIETKVQEILQKRDAAVQEAQYKTSMEEELEKSKQRVLQEFPDVEEEGTESNKLYRQAMNEDPAILRNPRGPLLAMYRMKELMEESGVVPKSLKPMVNKEAQRLARAGASSVIGRTASPNGKITLTREQKIFCDRYKIPYEQYAKNLKAQEAGGE